MSTKNKVIVKKLETIFARFDIPGNVFSDNEPQYSSSECFVSAVTHTTFRPHYAQSNA